jgi:hypothetical protein
VNIVEPLNDGQYNSQYNNRIPYPRNHDNQFIDTVEAGWLPADYQVDILRMMNRGHHATGIVLLISSAATFFVLINSDYGDNSFMVWLFWSLFAVAFLSLAKAIS